MTRIDRKYLCITCRASIRRSWRQAFVYSYATSARLLGEASMGIGRAGLSAVFGADVMLASFDN